VRRILRSKGWRIIKLRNWKSGGTIALFYCACRWYRSYAKAEVTAGGVDTKELSSKTMAVNKVPGLYFIGEVVDVNWLAWGL